MEMRYPVHQDAINTMNADEIYAHFHIANLFVARQLNVVYSHVDRVIIGGVMWAMAGENQTFTDMDAIAMNGLH